MMLIIKIYVTGKLLVRPDRIFLVFTVTQAQLGQSLGARQKDSLPGYAEIGKAQGGPGFINTVDRIEAKQKK